MRPYLWQIYQQGVGKLQDVYWSNKRVKQFCLDFCKKECVINNYY